MVHLNYIALRLRAVSRTKRLLLRLCDSMGAAGRVLELRTIVLLALCPHGESLDFAVCYKRAYIYGIVC